MQTGELITTFKGHDSEIYTLAVSPDSKKFISDNSKIWNLQTGELITTISGTEFYHAIVSPDWKNIVRFDSSDEYSYDHQNDIKVWNLQTDKLKATLTGHTANVNVVAISPDGKTLVSGSKDNTIKIWRMPKS